MLHTIRHSFLALIAGIMLTGCEPAQEPKISTPKQGEQYVLLPQTLDGFELAPVTEVFSLICGHCRTLESMIPELQNATGETFGKIPVTFNQNAQVAAIIYYTAVLQIGGVPDHALMEDLFAAVQMGSEFTQAEKEQALNKVFTERGLQTPYTLTDEQKEVLFEMLARADVITEQAQINSVPTFIVNSKYQVLPSAHTSSEQIANTISYLLSQP
ncbi:thiol:disulfide interchange protein DsbA/DsbL [Vibrio sp. SM6]|uniref:Thiol:disulfide interchange protein DsbA/DsbL n=1 Tax=Vibrio agarilyticus TaxID=2726741 RepID=A0A7X8TTF4_9VIBR|nr:thiol:disulfide interchange protein DsbA/DsbL [Vibrio agarilyticus]NLS14570.1 thiol:disulfide interchange protein DsbA/DsbL [Vibrio agarilyticus]